MHNEKFYFDQQKKLKHGNNYWFIKLTIVFAVTGESFAKS